MQLPIDLASNKSQKGLPLEIENTQNHENRRLGLIESLHMQRCSPPPPPPPPPHDTHNFPPNYRGLSGIRFSK